MNGVNRTDLWGYSLLIIDDDAPSEIEILMFDFNKTTRLQERQAIAGMSNYVFEVRVHLVELLSIFVILRHKLLVIDLDRSLDVFLLS